MKPSFAGALRRLLAQIFRPTGAASRSTRAAPLVASREPPPKQKPPQTPLQKSLNLLKRLLDGTPDARKRLVHLSIVEQTLRVAPDTGLTLIPLTTLDKAIWQVDSICRTRSGAQYAALLDPLRLALITAASRPTTQRRQTQSRQTQAAASGMPARMSPGLAASPLIEHDSVLGRVDFADTQPLTDGHLLAAYAVQPRSSG